jgi:transposase
VLGVEHTVIESVELETDERGQELLVARVRVKAGAARRCSRCQRRCPAMTPARRRGAGGA